VKVRTFTALGASLALILISCGCSSSGGAKQEETSVGPPPLYRIDFDTSRGAFVVEVHTDWAPYGSARLYELVKKGFYDGDRFFRVVRGFVVQFGINGDPVVNRDWANATMPDDPRQQHNERGTLSYAATSMPNSRSTQLFINLRDNSPSLDPLRFAPVGKVISGMDVVDQIYAGYGDMPPNGAGPDPSQIQMEGNAYLTRRFPHLDYIKTATIEK
jgi:peptidyl-prolyl cis-trans isomerase A (cyclophilin A)